MSTQEKQTAMFRFLLVRIASAIPVLFVLSVVTFAIIQAPPGDYSDYIRSQLINQGGASFEEADAQAQAYKVANGLDKPLPVQYVNWITGIVTRGDFGHSLFYNKPVADVVGERLPRTLVLALVCHILASVIGITFGILAATRQYSWVDSLLSGISFLGMTVPRFLMALIIVYILVFHFNVIGDQQLPLRPLRRRALVVGQVRRSREACLAGDRHRHLWRPRLQYAGDARQSARYAERPVCRDRAGQGPERKRRDHAPCRAQRAASAGHVSGRRAALHADRRDRDGDHLRAADRRPGHRRLHVGRRRLCHRHLHAGAVRDADRRQHHRRHAAGAARSARSPGRRGTTHESRRPDRDTPRARRRRHSAIGNESYTRARLAPPEALLDRHDRA